MSGAIDVHSHVFPAAFLDLLAGNGGPVRAEREGDAWIVRYADTQTFTIDTERYDPRAKLEAMDAAGIDVALLSPNIPGPDLLDDDLVVPAARILNDGLAEAVAVDASRYAALASLPWTRPREAVEELARAHDELGFVGISLHSHLGGRPVDDAAFEPVYAAIASRELPLVLHPTVPTWGEAVKDHQMIPMMGLQVDCSFALLRLILGGVLERHQALRVVMPHAGGVLPYLLGRVEHQTEVLRRGRTHLRRPVRGYLERVWYDTVAPSVETVAFALRSAGPGRLLFGTDHPWVDMGRLVRVIEELELPDEEREAILHGNARALFALERTARRSGAAPA